MNHFAYGSTGQPPLIALVSPSGVRAELILAIFACAAPFVNKTHGQQNQIADAATYAEQASQALAASRAAPNLQTGQAQVLLCMVQLGLNSLPLASSYFGLSCYRFRIRS